MKRILAILLLAAMLMLSGCTPTQLPPAMDSIHDNYRVFYHVFVGSFSDSNEDGLGDLRGLINRLDYINDGDVNSGTDLGAQGIWLSPIFSSPSYHKYDCRDYYKIDSRFGSESDLKELAELCEERNVKLILDLVLNHTSNQHPWFQSFVAAHQSGDTSDPYYDYYTWVTADQQVSGRTYSSIANSGGHFYECNFSGDMPELNLDNEEVRQACLDIARYYLDLGVDGFRFDAIKYAYFGDTQKSTEFWKWYMDELRAIKPDIYAVGECWSSDNETLEYTEGVNCFNFQMAQSEGFIANAARGGSLSTFTKYVESYQDRLLATNPDAMMVNFIANHDTDRAAGFLTVSSGNMYMAANLYILCSGSPFIYYGEEIGMKGTRGGASTDANRRLAMLWGDGDTVKDPVGTTFDADKQLNGTVADQLKDENSLLRYYGRLIAMRNKYPEIARGDYEALTFSQDNFGGFRITYGESVIGLFHNNSTEEITISLDGFSQLCDFIGQGKASFKDGCLVIGPHTSVIVK